MNTLQKFEAKHLEKVTSERQLPEFSPGDTIKVNVKIREGNTERIQAYEGVCIARHDKGINASFTVRKISYNEGVERVFPLFSPRIDSIELIRRGSVRRAKLYYLRDRRGKSARIAERTSGHGIEKQEAVKKASKKASEKAAKKTTAKKSAKKAAKKAKK
jgi:large subunit ribosomal protein L19